jgi:hypothetical protein
MIDRLIVGLLSVVTGFVAGLFKSWLDSRLQLDAETRKERWEAYKKLWNRMTTVPKWPRDENLAYQQLIGFSGQCRDWYFTFGGFHLSRASQKTYNAMQQTITDAAEAKTATDKVSDPEYDHVQQACSALRTQLTLDLHSRQRGLLQLFGL